MRKRQLRLPRHDNAKENERAGECRPSHLPQIFFAVKSAPSVFVACRSTADGHTLNHRVLVKTEVLLNVAGCQTPLFQILLVIILGLEKGLCGHDLGMNLFAEAPRFHQLFL